MTPNLGCFKPLRVSSVQRSLTTNTLGTGPLCSCSAAAGPSPDGVAPSSIRQNCIPCNGLAWVNWGQYNRTVHCEYALPQRRPRSEDCNKPPGGCYVSDVGPLMNAPTGHRRRDKPQLLEQPNSHCPNSIPCALTPHNGKRIDICKVSAILYWSPSMLPAPTLPQFSAQPHCMA